MGRQPRTAKLRDNVGLVAWGIVVAFVMSLILFGAMLAAAYVVDEFCSPPLNESSVPPPRTHD